MRLLSQTDFLPAVQVAPVAPRRYVLTVLVKATFDLQPGATPQPAPQQAFPTGDDPLSGIGAAEPFLRYASDFAVFKPRADISLSGNVYCRPETREWTAAMRVGDYQKSRVYQRREAQVARQRQPAPDPRFGPAEFFPLSVDSPQRQSLTGTYNAAWQRTQFPGPPTDFDWSFYNAAPADQQLDGYLRGDESLFFENLHPQHSRYHSRLPGVRVRGFLHTSRDPAELAWDLPGKNAPAQLRPDAVLPRSGGTWFYELAINLDTLWVDLEAEQLVLVWRGVTPIHTDDYREIEHLYLLTESLSEPQYPLRHSMRSFEEMLAAADTPEGQLATVPACLAPDLPALPDVEQELARADRQLGDLTAMSVDSGRVNSEMSQALGDNAPQLAALAGLGLDAQLEALSRFADEVAVMGERVAADRQTALRSRLEALGLDPDSATAEQQQQATVEIQQVLQDEGLADNLQEADQIVKETAIQWLRSPFNLAALGIDLSGMLLGLKGIGVDTDKLKSDLGLAIGDEPLSRETVQRRLAAGESFQGELLLELDLAECDLRNADFRDAMLVKVNLAGADLSGADFSRAVLSQVDLTQAKLFDTRLTKANLCGSIFTGANLRRVQMNGALAGTIKADRAVFRSVHAPGVDFTGSDFTGSRLEHCVLGQADLSKCKLEGTSFRQSDLQSAALDEATGSGTDFTAADLRKVRASRGCQLPGAVFHQARMQEGNWSNADLSRADLSYAQLDGAFLMATDLSNADLSAANLRQARLSKAKLADALLQQANLFQTVLDKSDLSRADLSGAMAYGADFFEAVIDDALLEHADLRRTVLTTVRK